MSKLVDDILVVLGENERLKERVRTLEAALEASIKEADCLIPFYAYGDNEAACDMAHRLNTICDVARAALREEGK